MLRGPVLNRDIGLGAVEAHNLVPAENPQAQRTHGEGDMLRAIEEVSEGMGLALEEQLPLRRFVHRYECPMTSSLVNLNLAELATVRNELSNWLGSSWPSDPTGTVATPRRPELMLARRPSP